jgi:hypothetical protein
LGQQQPLRNAETVLLINHRQTQFSVADRLLKDRVGSDQYINTAIGQPHEGGFARTALIPAGQDRKIDRKPRQLALERLKMLAR